MRQAKIKVSEAATLRGQFRRSKYGAIRTVVDNITFDSKAEARRYGELKWMEKVGDVSEIIVHPHFSISVNGILICMVELDFQYLAKDKRTFEDVKGRDNALSRLKRKLVEAQYGIKVKLIRYGRG